MSSEGATQPVAAFQHRPVDGSCQCPIHRNCAHPPFTAPLGYRFGDDVSVEPIRQETAEEIYQAHHGYMTGNLHPANLAHHGLYYYDLLGAITYRYPFFRKKRIHVDDGGRLIAQPYTDEEFAALPDHLEARARRLLGDTTPDDVATTEVLSGDRFVEANRICIGERMPNLASCSLAASQEAFVDSEACPEGIEYLITYVVADFEGSMIKALRGKGWTCIGYAEPSRAGNREHKTIRDRYKWVFACPVSTVYEQAGLDDWAAYTPAK